MESNHRSLLFGQVPSPNGYSGITLLYHQVEISRIELEISVCRTDVLPLALNPRSLRENRTPIHRLTADRPTIERQGNVPPQGFEP